MTENLATMTRRDLLSIARVIRDSNLSPGDKTELVRSLSAVFADYATWATNAESFVGIATSRYPENGAV